LGHDLDWRVAAPQAPLGAPEALLWLDFLAGIRGTDLSAITAADLDRKVLAARGSDAVLKMIPVDDFFHADPQPGNVLFSLATASP
jgi:predicted unusual protein kinase regulating ubiquinone biosynthesis (AarF/ABC1/UbiB family)